MIERGVVLRGFFALFLIAAVLSAAYVMFSDTDGTSGNFLEDDDSGKTSYAYGPIFEDPNGFRSETLADPFVRKMRVSGGTFGNTITKQVRIDIDGSGPIPTRDVTLQTKPAVDLFAGPRRDRAEEVIHGIQRILEERGGLIEGISFTRTQGGVEAAAISGIIEKYPTSGVLDPSEQRFVVSILREVSRELARGTFAWYDQRFQQIVFGPVISKGVLAWIQTPARTTPAKNIFTAYVVRHELEHAVTPTGGEALDRYRWLEEGTADTMALWPGAAADTARELGMTYPKSYEDKAYSTKLGGYPDYTASVRLLLTAAGVDVRDPKALAEATALLQEHELENVPAVLADEIATRDRLTPGRQAQIERSIRGLDGSVPATRRLVASL